MKNKRSVKFWIGDSVNKLILMAKNRIFSIVGSIVLLLVCCFYGPNVGENANKDNLIFGVLEQYNQEQVNDSLTKITVVYGTVKLVSVLPTMFKDAGGFGVKFGAVLQPIVDQIDRVSSVLFAAWVILGIQKLMMGFTSYLACKMFVAGVVMYWIGVFSASLSQIRRVGVFLIQFGFLLLLFIPATSYINKQIKDEIGMTKQVNEFEVSGKDLDKESREITSQKQPDEEEQKQIDKELEDKGFFEKVGDKTLGFFTSVGESVISAGGWVVDKAKKIVGWGSDSLSWIKKGIEDLLQQMMKIVMSFVLTCVVVPVGVAFVFVGIFKAINIPETQVFYQKPKSDKKKTSGDE